MGLEDLLTLLDHLGLSLSLSLGLSRVLLLLYRAAHALNHG